MKNAFFCLTALILFTAAFSSCKKEPSFKELLVGTWKSVEVKAGATDLTNSNSFDLRLEASNEFDLDITAMVPLAGKVIESYNGDWTTDATKQDITLTYSGSGETKTWEITTLSETSLTAELVENSVRYQVRFARQ